jgi:hypothetical protein
VSGWATPRALADRLGQGGNSLAFPLPSIHTSRVWIGDWPRPSFNVTSLAAPMGWPPYLDRSEPLRATSGAFSCSRTPRFLALRHHPAGVCAPKPVRHGETRAGHSPQPTNIGRQCLTQAGSMCLALGSSHRWGTEAWGRRSTSHPAGMPERLVVTMPVVPTGTSTSLMVVTRFWGPKRDRSERQQTYSQEERA